MLNSIKGTIKTISFQIKIEETISTKDLASTSSSGTLPSNTVANLRSDLKVITTQSGLSYDGPQIPPPPSFLPKVVENEPKATKDTMNPTNNESTEDVQPQVIQSKSPILIFEPITSPISEPVIAPVSTLKPNLKTLIPYPSSRNDEKNREKANNQIEKFYQIFKDMSFKISFEDALILMPKYSSTLKALIGNKEKFREVARTQLNEHCSAVFLKKLPKKLGDPGMFLIPCDFSGMAECLALADLGASINLMPFSVWKRLSLPNLTPTYFDADPRVPLILERSFFKTERALIDVFEAVELKDLHPHLEYAFLEGDNKLPVIIAKYFSVEEKTALITVLKSHKRAIAWKLSYIKGIDPEFYTHKILMEEDFEPTVQHQRRVNLKIHDVIKQEVIKILDAGLIYPISDSPWEKTIFTCLYGSFAYRLMPFGLCNAPGTFQRNSFQSCLSHLERMMKRCKDTNLCLNWEKSHFMVKEGIVLGHKIFKQGIEVDKVKMDVINKLPHPTTVKEAESNYTTTKKEMLVVVYAFEKFWSYLILNKSIAYTDHFAVKYMFAKKDSKARSLRWVLLLQEFTFKVIDTKGAESLAADNLS
nr:reverse transcriptase domain-containing protein [Tanacetum cinerariifolium]